MEQGTREGCAIRLGQVLGRPALSPDRRREGARVVAVEAAARVRADEGSTAQAEQGSGRKEARPASDADVQRLEFRWKSRPHSAGTATNFRWNSTGKTS